MSQLRAPMSQLWNPMSQLWAPMSQLRAPMSQLWNPMFLLRKPMFLLRTPMFRLRTPLDGRLPRKSLLSACLQQTGEGQGGLPLPQSTAAATANSAPPSKSP